MIDKSLHFGQQNFFFVDSDETDVTYDYVAYMNKKGSILLARYNKLGSIGRYCIVVGTYATIWAARATQTYVLPNELTDQNV
jgi:hypothetical protein